MKEDEKERKKEGEQVYIYLLKRKEGGKKSLDTICVEQRIHTNINSI